MTDKEFIESADKISVEMNKFNSKTGKGGNFGFITRDGIDFRFFVGGSMDSIMNGLATTIATLSKMAEVPAEVLYSDLLAETTRILRKNSQIQPS